MQWPTITEETDLDEVFEIHRRIWDEVLKNFEETGTLQKPNTPYKSDCALCEYSWSCLPGSLGCIDCPADWNSFACCSSRVYSTYIRHRLNCMWLGLRYSKLHHDDIVESIKAIRDIPRKKI